MPATRNRIALAMRMSAETMISAPSSTAATECAKNLAIITAAIDWGSDIRIGQRTDPASRAIVAALDAMEAIQARYDLVKKWGVGGNDAVALRNAAAQFDAALSRIPFNVYEAARIFVEQQLAPTPTQGAS